MDLAMEGYLTGHNLNLPGKEQVILLGQNFYINNGTHFQCEHVWACIILTK
jgi:hypothetical protein